MTWYIIYQRAERLEKKNKRLTETIIEDLEHIKILLEKYNKGEGSLAEIWDFVNTRLDVYREE